MQCNFAIVKWRLDRPVGNILQDILRGSVLCVLGVENLTALIEFDDIRKDGVNLIERARLAEDAGIINALKQRKTNRPVGLPE